MVFTALCLMLQNPQSVFLDWSAPAGMEYAQVVPGGRTVLPNGRFLTPKGNRVWVGEGLWHLVRSDDGEALAGIHTGDGYKEDSGPGIVIYSNLKSLKWTRKHVAIKDIAPCGTFTPDGKRFLVSLGESGALGIFETTNWTQIGKVESNDKTHKFSYLNDIAVSKDGKKAFAVDVAGGRVISFDLKSNSLIDSAPAGREPYTCKLSSSGSSLFVANIGMFDYSLVPPPATEGFSQRGLSIPAFGFPSRKAELGKFMEGRQVPGLGKAQVVDAQSVWRYSLDSKLVAARKATSGILIHSPADQGKSVGGSAPNELLVRGKELYVSNANNDSISVFDATSLKILRTIRLQPHPSLNLFRGVIPSGMAMDQAGKRLYVCESGLNAVAVIEPQSGKTLGHIPTGWFPMKVVLSKDERTLYIATQKGLGRGPRGPEFARKPEDERFGLPDMPSMIDATPVPSASTLSSYSKEVLLNNGLSPVSKQVNPIAGAPGKPSSKIKYVVFITKENHTYDGIFGGLKFTRGKPEYAEFGMEGWIREKGMAERLPIMPNHIRLAEQFGISDNFYMEPQASGDGHRWLVGVYPSLWTTRVFYAGWDFKRTNEAPGRLVSFGSNGSQIPEDYLENGSLWEHLARNGIPFRNYGEGYELPDNDEEIMTNRSGAFTQVNYPMPQVLYQNTCFNFPAYNNNIPDIARADWFFEDIVNYRESHSGALPKFLNIAICNDHGSSPMPNRGYPYTCSFMADNDLALGRIVEFLSKQPEWKEMAIFVTQDDPGGDNDHVDRHRSFVLGISPWIKRGYVSHQHTSIMSIIKQIYRLFGLGPNNMYDAVATDMSDFFTDKPDFTPYQSVLTDPRVFKPNDTFDPFDPNFVRRRSEKPEAEMDDPEFVEKLRNR